MRLWKNYVKTEKKMRMFESEQYLEVWALSIHFYEQTLINKGFLSLKKLMIARKIAKKSKYVKQEIVQKRLIRNAFKVWREKFTNISQRRGKVFKSLNHWGMKMQKVVINKLKHKVIQSKHKRLVVLDKYLETRATVFIALMLKSPQIMQKWNAKTDLEQVVNQSILRRYKDFSPFIAQSIKKYYMSKVFNELFQHKKKAIQQGRYAVKFRKAKLLRKFEEQCKKQNKLKTLQYKVTQNSQQKKVWILFVNWLAKASLRITARENLEKSFNFREKQLKSKVLRSLLLFLNLNIQAISQLKQSNSTKLSKIIKQVYNGWKFVAVYNRRQRLLMREGRKIQTFGLKSHYFMLWIKTAILVAKSRLHNEKRIKSKVFRSFQQILEFKEIKSLYQQETETQYKLRIMKQIYERWLKYTIKSQQERNLRRTVLKYMHQVKQRQVLYAWKEQNYKNKTTSGILGKTQNIQKLKILDQAFQSLSYFTSYKKSLRQKQADYQMKLKMQQESKILLSWLCLFNKKLTLKQKHKKIAVSNIKNFMSNYFSYWLNLSSNQNHKRNNFYRNRAINLIFQAFSNFKQFTIRRKHFKEQLHEFLKIRANNLMFKALSGLYAFSKQNEIQRKLRKVSAYIFLEKTLRKHFTKMKKFWQIGRIAKKVKINHSRKTVINHMNLMKQSFIKQDIVKRFQLNQGKKAMIRCFKVYLKYHQCCQEKKKKITKGLLLYTTKLKALAFVSIQQHLQNIRAKQQIMSSAYQGYQINLLRNCLQSWYNYTDLKNQKFKVAKALFQKNQMFLQRQILFGFYFNAKKNQKLKSIMHPLIQNRNRKTMRLCLVNFYRYSFQKTILRSNLKRYQQQDTIQLQVRILNALYENTLTQKFQKDLKIRQQNFQRIRLYKKSLFSFLKNKLRQQYEKNILKQASLNIASKYLQQWINNYNDNQKIRPLEKIADLFLLKKAFDIFTNKMCELIKIRQIKQNYNYRAEEFYSQKNKQRAIQKMLEHSHLQRIRKMKIELADKIYIKRVFNQWKYNQVEIHKDKMQHQLVQNFQIYNLQRKAFENLVFGVQLQQNQYRKSNQMLQKRNIKLLRKYFYRLARNVQTQSVIIESLKDKMRVVDRIQMRPRFETWKWFTNEENKVLRAKNFRVERGATYIQRRYFDYLRIAHFQRKDLMLRKERVIQMHNQFLREKYFTIFLQKATQSLMINKRYSDFSDYQNNKKLRSYFEGILQVINLIRERKYKKEIAVSNWAMNLFRKSFVSLQRNHCFGQLHKIISIKHKQRINGNSMIKWKQSFLQSQGLCHVFNVLEQNHNHRMKQVFLQRLVKLAFYQQIFETLQSKRLHKYSLVFINLLRQNLYFNQVIYQFTLLRNEQRKKLVFTILQNNWVEQKGRQEAMDSQLNCIVEENNCEQIRSCFDQMKLYSQSSKIKKQAMFVYIHRLMKRAFMGMQIVGIKQQKIQNAHSQTKLRQTLKYFCKWISAYQKSKQEQILTQVHASNMMVNILDQWRQYAQKQKVARYFHTMKIQQNQVPIAFHSIKYYTERQRYLKYCEQEIKQNNMFQNIKNVMLNWMEFHNLKKISLNMKKFHGFKQLKNVIDEWRLYTQESNRTRQIIREFQQFFYDKPYLVKPLLAIRNVSVYKAFQAMKLGTKISNESIIHRNNSIYIFYMKLMRKAFFSIKLYISKRQQDKKLRALRNHFVVRRWYSYLQQATVVSQENKRRRRESAIFKVLNIQRKAFNMLLQFASERQQDRIKIQFAEELYFKRLADKVIISLRINAAQERQAYESQVMSGQNQTIQNDQTMGNNQSRYEQDLSNLQLECSLVQDYKEKKRLVTELYQKKMLYRIFVSWGNLALCVSDEGDESRLLMLSRDDGLLENNEGNYNYNMSYSMNNKSVLSTNQNLQNLLQTNSTYSNNQILQKPQRYGAIEMTSPVTQEKDRQKLLLSGSDYNEHSITIIDQDYGNGRNFDDYEVDEEAYNDEQEYDYQQQFNHNNQNYVRVDEQQKYYNEAIEKSSNTTSASVNLRYHQEQYFRDM